MVKSNYRSNRRIAVVVEDVTLLRWQAACIKELAQTVGVECILVLSQHSGFGIVGAAKKLLGRYLFPRTLLPAQKDDPVWSLQKIDGCDKDKKLQEYAPNILLYLGAGRPDLELYSSCSEGVWFFRFGGQAGACRSLLSWLGVLRGRKKFYAMLVSSKGVHDSDVVLQSGCFRVKPHYVGRSIDVLLQTIKDWPAATSFRLSNGVGIQQSITDPQADSENPMLCGAASFWQLCAMLEKLLFRATMRPFEDEQWCIGWISRPISEFLENQLLDELH